MTTAGTTPRARTVSAVSYTTSGIDDLALPLMRPVSVSRGFRDRLLSTHSPQLVPGDMEAVKKHQSLGLEEGLVGLF